MLRVLSGFAEQLNNDWLRGSVQETFSYDVQPDWFDDPIVKEALYELDDIVDVMGVALKKSDGLVIPPEWLSHGCKQFISMTRDPSLVCDGFYFGWNVYKFFHKWSVANNTDVTLLLNDCTCVNETYQMNGIILNNGQRFENNMEMGTKILQTRKVHLFNSSNDVIPVRKFKRNDNDEIYYYGKEFQIKL